MNAWLHGSTSACIRARGGGGHRSRAPPPPRALMHALVEPWSHAFMQRALLELVLLGVVGGLVGCWVVFYELAYSTESLAHALFPGLVLAAQEQRRAC